MACGLICWLLVNHLVKRSYTGRVSRSRMRAMGSEEVGGWRSSVDEDVVFLEFLDVSLNLVHLGL